MADQAVAPNTPEPALDPPAEDAPQYLWKLEPIDADAPVVLPDHVVQRLADTPQETPESAPASDDDDEDDDADDDDEDEEDEDSDDEDE